ncbi:hypothetical protein SAMN05216345_101882 [Cupriavidus sp. YR651]|uniref:hypothetical protein n=1 Tax=Cupriavidus sp. YR651 TaxID=1855315 RepID=UPI00088AB481|nr:hypothetical protein [Cupriavidus sp. YR651]SDC19568.1 hypothetical protein SAMN05216345_101882 [Cupriavidus sp. YR651]
MSKSIVLELHKPEEEIAIEIGESLEKCVLPTDKSPIEDYFKYTQGLIARFVRPEFSGDVETLSLLLLGIVSAAEFYFRTILVRSLDICPLARKQAERIQIPLGSLGYYGTKTAALGLSIFEHKSLAGANEVKNELQRLVGVDIKNNSSVAAALSGFDTLCELRHAAIHARGYIGSKGASDLGVSMDALRKISFSQSAVFDLTKLSHNAVRSFNRYVFKSMLERWISESQFTGHWRSDKAKFKKLFDLFSYPPENPFAEDLAGAYKLIRPSIQARNGSAQKSK